MGIQYKVDDTDTSLKDLVIGSDGYVIRGTKTTTGAPATTAGKFQIGCQIQNTNSGLIYVNTGTLASPTWSTLATV